MYYRRTHGDSHAERASDEAWGNKGVPSDVSYGAVSPEAAQRDPRDVAAELAADLAWNKHIGSPTSGAVELLPTEGVGESGRDALAALGGSGREGIILSPSVHYSTTIHHEPHRH